MADISSLGNLQSAEPLDLPQYKDAQEPQGLPKSGRYTVQAPSSFQTTAFGATRAGFLSAQIDPTIIGPTNEGYTIKFTKVSAKPFKRSGLTVSQLGDYLRATGLRTVVPGDPQAQADAVEATANLVYEVTTDWRAYCKGCGHQVEGEKHFPSDGNGGHSPFVTCPTCKDDTGGPLRLRGNLVVTRFIAPSSNGR